MIHEQYLALVQQNKYIYSLSILIVFYILSQLVVFVSRKIILQITRKTKTDIDDLVVRKTSKPISLILMLIGIRLALLPIGIKPSILDIIENTISSLVIIVITYIVIVVFGIFIDNWGKRVAEKTKSSVDEQLMPVIHRFSRIFVSIVGLLFILTVWGIQIGPLLTSLGIAGIAIAFALQSTLGNIFGGMSIILDKSVRVGDVIKLDNETIGTVVDVGLRSTKVKTMDNELITIPNGKLADSRILNYLHPDPTLRVSVDFSTEYGSDVSKVRKVVLETLGKIPSILKKPEPAVILTEMADSGLKFKALLWVSSFEDKNPTKFNATEEIYNALRKAGIGIPFPTRTVYLKEEKGWFFKYYIRHKV